MLDRAYCTPAIDEIRQRRYRMNVMTVMKLRVLQDQGTAGNVPGPGAAGTRRGSVNARQLRRSAGLVGLTGLAAGALCLIAACSTSASSPPAAASGPAATPTQSATQPSSPASSSPGTGSSGAVTAAPASGAQVASFTAAAQGNCGFSSSADTLTNAKVTDNGWGSATITADNPADQGNASMVFQMGTTWAYVSCGSSFDNGTIPQDVLTALGL
jgi:hypothetical protein